MSTVLVKKRSLHSRRTGIFPYLLLLPALLLFTVFVFYPFFKTIILTFFLTNVRGEAVRYVGWGNYTRILKSSAFLNALKNSFRFA